MRVRARPSKQNSPGRHLRLKEVAQCSAFHQYVCGRQGGGGLGGGAFYALERTDSIPQAILDQQPLSKRRDGSDGASGWGGGGAHDRDKEGRGSLKPVTQAC